ncbi:MAG: hypothetical protein RLP44_01900 [Aggregatilineales bacterium]
MLVKLPVELVVCYLLMSAPPVHSALRAVLRRFIENSPQLGIHSRRNAQSPV